MNSSASAAGKRTYRRPIIGLVAVVLAIFLASYVAQGIQSTDNTETESVVPAGDQATGSVLKTGSRSPYVHIITLYDAQGRAIDPSAPDAKPYSPMMTCGKCHDMGTIEHGWHFNAMQATLSKIEQERGGEPWWLTDHTSRSHWPMSPRAWKGAISPKALGLEEWMQARRVGSHVLHPFTGDSDRWKLSGNLEIDCMSCHDTTGPYSMEARQQQIQAYNHQYVPTVALGLGQVTGSSVNIKLDPLAEFDPEYTGPDTLPVRYNRSLFRNDQRIYLPISREVSDANCYQCHTVMQVGEDAPPAHKIEGDVHLSKGSSCVDCHSHGLDHDMNRGLVYRTDQPGATINAMSCQGCHLGDEETPAAAHFGAPRPIHAGLPPLHLEKMTCTACHSGPLPEQYTHLVQTSLAHKLGLPRTKRNAEDQPLIVEPVFRRNAAGELAPYRQAWPAWFGTMDQAGEITPMRQMDVEFALLGLDDFTGDHKHWLKEALLILAEYEAVKLPGEEYPKAVRIEAGLLWQLDDNKDLVSREHAQAAAYRWPLGHDVRPAGQSLGARGCQECHSENAAIYFGFDLPKVDDPARLMLPAQASQQFEWRGESSSLLLATAWLFEWRSPAKVVLSLMLAVFVLVLGAGVFMQGIALTRAKRLPVDATAAGAKHSPTLAPQGWLRRWPMVLMLAVAVAALSPVWSILTQGYGNLSGWSLLGHVVVAPLAMLVVLAGLIALLWRGQQTGWIAAIAGCAVVCVGSILLAMSPWLPADWHPAAYLMHALSAALLVISVILAWIFSRRTQTR